MRVIGYYLGNGREMSGCAVCASCATEDEETSADNAPIFSIGCEADAPTHCARCEDLIPHALTLDGERYVREALGAYVTSGQGRAEILDQWAARWPWLAGEVDAPVRLMA